MLAIADVPETVMDLYHEGKALVKEILAHLHTPREVLTVKRNTNLAAAHPASIIFIDNGIFKYFYSDRFVRFYSSGDILAIEQTARPAVNIFSEFATNIIVYEEKDFFQRLHASPPLLSDWISYQILQNHLMHALSSVYAGEDFKPEINIKNYNVGDILIREGEPPDFIFEMIEGRAVVTIKGAEVGVINEREIFGEIGFLTGSLRIATVTATSPCIVQLIEGQQLEKIAKHQPAMVYALSKNLAKRLTEANLRLVGKPIAK